MNTGQLKSMRLMGLALVMGVGLCVLIVWDQTRSVDVDAGRSTRQQVTMSRPAEPGKSRRRTPPHLSRMLHPPPRAARPTAQCTR